MDWLKDHAYLSGWLALPLAAIAMYIQNRGKKLSDVSWARPLLYFAFLTSLAVAFNQQFDTTARVSAQGVLYFTMVTLVFEMNKKRK